MFLVLLVAVALGASAILLRRPFNRARSYIRDVSTCGYLAPPPTARAVKWAHRIGRMMVFVHVGKVELVGVENLPMDGTRILTAPNHSHPADNFLMPYVLNRPTRYMAALGWMRIGFGLGALITGPMGTFCVDTRPGKGRPAQEAAIRALVQQQSVNVFGEAGAFPDGVMRDLRTGIVRITREAAIQSGTAVKVVPMYIRYGRYAPAWIMCLPEALRYLVIFANPWYFRRGVIVVFGKAFDSTELPDDVDAANALLRSRITSLDPAKIAR